MTFELLNKIIEENNIPKDVHLMSDSGWECGETEMNGVYYNRKENVLIFTQRGDECDSWFEEDDLELLYSYNKICRDCKHLDECGYCIKRTEKGFGQNFYMSINGISDCGLYEERSRYA